MKGNLKKRALALCMTAAMVMTSCPAALVSAEEFTDDFFAESFTDDGAGLEDPFSDPAPVEEPATEVFGDNTQGEAKDAAVYAAGETIVTNNEHTTSDTALEIVDGSVTFATEYYETVYLKYTPDVSGEYAISVNADRNGEYWDVSYYFYDNINSYGNQVFTNDPTENPYVRELEAGKTYYIKYPDRSGDTVVNMQIVPSTIALTYKNRVTAVYGEKTPLTVNASSTAGDVTYQWYVRELPADSWDYVYTRIDGADTATYIFDPAGKTEKNGRYKCVISDGVNTRNAVFEITVQSITYEGDQYQYPSFIAGQEGVLSVNASSSYAPDGLKYEWKYQDENYQVIVMEDVTGPSYTIASASKETPEYFYCTISDGLTEAVINFQVSVTAELNVGGNRTTYLYGWPGDKKTLKVSATSAVPITYTWDKNDEVLSNETGDTCEIVLEPGNAFYTCRIEDGYDSEERYFDITVYDEETTRRPVKVELAPGQTDWHIYEHTGGSDDSIIEWPGGGFAKVTYADGKEEYVSNSECTEHGAFTPDRESDGTWKQGTYRRQVTYNGVSAYIDVYVARAGENGSVADLTRGNAVNGQKAGSVSPAYKYYRILADQSGVFEFDFTNVKGQGNVGLYVIGTVPPVKEKKFDNSNGKLTYTLEKDNTYFLVIKSNTAGADFIYDLAYQELQEEITLGKRVPISESGAYTFTPKVSGFYSLDTTYYRTPVYNQDMELVDYLNSNSSIYLKAGQKYFIRMETSSSGATYLFTMTEEKTLAGDVVKAYKENGFIVSMDGQGTVRLSGKGAFSGYGMGSHFRSEEICKLIVEEGITKIDDYVFDLHENLTEVSLPASLQELGDGAFMDCAKLLVVNIPSGSALTEIGEDAFAGTAFISNPEISGNYLMIRDIVLAYRGKEVQTVVPENAVYVAGSAMRGSDTLKKITILEKLKKIGKFGMADCDSLEAMDVPGNVTDIQYCAFYSDSALENVVLNEGVETVGEEAFFACDKLQTITIPKSVRSIGANAIGYSYAKQEFGGDWKHYPAKNLPTIFCYYRTEGYWYAKNHNIPYKLLDEKDIGNKEICHLSWTTTHDAPLRPEVKVIFAEDTLTKDKDYTVTYKAISATETEVKVTGIGDYFGSQTVKIGTAPDPTPAPKTSISGAVVKLSATSYYYDGKVKKPTVKTITVNGKALTAKDYTVTWKNNKNIGTGTVTITGAGKYIGTKTATFKIVAKKGSIFNYGTGKYKVTGASTVAYNGVKSKTTTKVSIPAYVKYGNKTFNVTSVSAKALYKNTAITQITVGNKVTTIGDYAFASCTKLKTVKLGTGVTTIGKYAMYKDAKLTTITISSQKLKTVKTGALKGIYAKAKIKVPSAKLKTYTKLLKGKGQSAKVKITK